MLPEYHGYDPMAESIHQFLEDFEDYCVVKNVSAANKVAHLNRAIKYPAWTEFTVNQGADAAFAIRVLDPVGDAAAQLAINEQNFTNCETWLIKRFFGQEQQEALQAVILKMRQGPDETPW